MKDPKHEVRKSKQARSARLEAALPRFEHLISGLSRSSDLRLQISRLEIW